MPFYGLGTGQNLGEGYGYGLVSKFCCDGYGSVGSKM